VFDTYSDIFSRRAHLYQRAMTNYPDARAAEFRAMLEPLGDAAGNGGSICDVPSGGGYLAAYLSSAAAYMAVEPTTAFASLFVPGENKRLVVAEARDMPFEDGQFDAVISLAGLHHEPDKRPVLQEICRIVKDGGMAVIADVAAGSREDAFLNGSSTPTARWGTTDGSWTTRSRPRCAAAGWR
jgi:SAM-dependent methyltransferase